MSTAINTTHLLETKPVGKLLVQYSVPAIVGMTVTSLYNIIDSIFIGHGVGPLAISGLAITFPLMNLVIAFCTLFGIGGATISSIYLGQKDVGKATGVLGNVLVLCVVFGVLFGGLAHLFLEPILRFFGASDDTLPYAYDFMSVLLYGNPLSFTFIGLNHLMRATGYPKKAMLTSLLTVGVNVVLAPIFIFHFGWGIKGAAIATLVSQFCGFLWILNHFLDKRNTVHFRRGTFRLRQRIVSAIVSIGMSPFLMNVCSCVIVVLLNTSFQRYGGDYAIGAYGIVNRVVMLFVMIELGLTQGMQPIIGYNYGARRQDRVLQALRLATIAGVSIMTFGFLMGELCPGILVSLFTDHAELTELAKTGMRITCVLYPLVGAQIIITNFFQSIGMAKVSIFLALSRQLLFLIPSLLIMPHFFGIEGVWASMPVADAVSVVVTVFTMLYFARRGLFKMA